MSVDINNLKKSDYFGATVSALCAIHCTLMPVLFAAKPILESTVHHDHHGHGFWRLFDFIFLVLSFIAVRYSAKYTQNQTFKWLFWLAWIIFAAGIFLEPLEMPYTNWLMHIGSITLVVTHLRNYRYCRSASV